MESPREVYEVAQGILKGRPELNGFVLVPTWLVAAKSSEDLRVLAGGVVTDELQRVERAKEGALPDGEAGC